MGKLGKINEHFLEIAKLIQEEDEEFLVDFIKMVDKGSGKYVMFKHGFEIDKEVEKARKILKNKYNIMSQPWQFRETVENILNSRKEKGTKITVEVIHEVIEECWEKYTLLFLEYKPFHAVHDFKTTTSQDMRLVFDVGDKESMLKQVSELQRSRYKLHQSGFRLK